MKKLLTIIFLSLALLGCNNALVKEFVSAPEVKAVRLADFSVTDKKVVFDVDLYNPNAFTLPISGLGGDFKLNDLTVGSLQASSQQQLAAYDTQTVSVPIKLDVDALTNAAKRVFSQGQAHYSFNGGVDTSIGNVPFSKSGKLSAQEIIAGLLK